MSSASALPSSAPATAQPPGASRKPWLALLTFILIGCGFAALYYSIGAEIARRELLADDLYFNSDTVRITRDITVPEAEHKRTNVHPLFVLYTNPFGAALTKLTGSTATAALLVNCATGGLSIALAGVFFFCAGIPLRRAALYALILGASTSHLFFGSMPETFSLSAASIITAFLVALLWPGRLWPAVAAGVFTFGVTVTNLGMSALAYATSLLPPRPLWVKLGQLLVYPILVIAIAAALSYTQKAIWGQTREFYKLKTFRAERRFMEQPTGASQVLGRELSLLRHVFAYDWFAPELHWRVPGRVGLKSDSLATIETPGRVALALWAALLLASVYLTIRLRLYLRPIHLGLALSLLFNLALHTVYGDDLFLYGCNTCFLVLALVAVSLNELRLTRWHAVGLDLGLVVLLAFQITNNQRFIARIQTIFGPQQMF